MGYGWAEHVVNFSILQGMTIKEIIRDGDESLTFLTIDDRKFKMSYYEGWWRRCYIEEIHGDLDDLLNTPILLAEEVCSGEPDEALVAKRKAAYEEAKLRDDPEDFYYYGPSEENGWKEESETWTFYKASTIKGSVTIRWYGSSNGYYSETATFEELKGQE